MDSNENKENGQKKENKSNSLIINKEEKDNKEIGMLINGKHPIYGSEKVKEIKGRANTLQIYKYPLNIEYSSKEE